jgi:TetR/AcrR family transcriptional repressor of nem operon
MRDSSPGAAKPLPHKERLLRQGTEDFYDLGFHGTTVDTILDHAAVPKGSFYHHFGSKDAFALEVLKRYHEYQMAWLGRWSERTDLSVPDRVRGYYLDLADSFAGSSFQRACLAGKFSSELANASASVRDQLATGLTEWRAGLESLIAAGQEAGEVIATRSARVLAESVLALLQGAFVVGMSMRDEQALRAIADSIDALLRP